MGARAAKKRDAASTSRISRARASGTTVRTEMAVDEEAAIEIGAERAREVAEILRALGHPLRLRLMALLCTQPMHVSALAAELGVAQVTVSQQLRILRLTRLVEVSRTAGQALYRLAEPNLRKLFACLTHGPTSGREDG